MRDLALVDDEGEALGALQRTRTSAAGQTGASVVDEDAAARAVDDHRVVALGADEELAGGFGRCRRESRRSSSGVKSRIAQPPVSR